MNGHYDLEKEKESLIEKILQFSEGGTSNVQLHLTDFSDI